MEVFVPPPRYNKVTKSESTKSRLFRLLLIVTFTLTIAFFPLLHSQEGVRIKERVEIGSREISRTDYLIIKDNLKTSGVVSGFVMPKSGELQVYYSFCNRIDRMLPANAALVVHFLRGDSSRSDRIISRFPNVTPWSRLIYNACYGIHQYRYQYNYTNTGYAEDVYVYNVGAVTEGDTIQLFYSSNSIVTGDSVLYGIYSADSVAPGSWNVVFGDYDWCIGDFNDVLNIYVGVEEKKSCEDAPQCEANMTAKIDLKELRSSEVSANPCVHSTRPGGVFRPLGMSEKPIESFDIKACFDRNTDRWRFNVPSSVIKVVLDICSENLSGYRVVDDISALSNREACFVLISMLLSNYEVYPIYVPFGGYIIRDILLAHEQEHKKDYYNALMASLPEFYKRLEEITLKCEEASNVNDAIEKSKLKVESKIMYLLNITYERFQDEKRSDEAIQLSLKNFIEEIRWKLIRKCSGV